MEGFCCCYLTGVNQETNDTLGDECLRTETGEGYTGHLNRTVSGIPCQRWADWSPHVHQYIDIEYFADYLTNEKANIHDVANYCRVPTAFSAADSAPWCFTARDDVEREFCNIPRCKSKHAFYDCTVVNPRLHIADVPRLKWAHGTMSAFAV